VCAREKGREEREREKGSIPKIRNPDGEMTLFLDTVQIVNKRAEI